MYLLRADCPTVISDKLIVSFAGSLQYNATGELACSNSGALFSNNISVSNDTGCNATAQWSGLDDLDCYTGLLVLKLISVSLHYVIYYCQIINVYNKKYRSHKFGIKYCTILELSIVYYNLKYSTT